MPAKLIEETDALPVSSLCVLIYGPPGVWKTSLAQTGDNPLTLDFDTGIHRSKLRRKAMRFDAWADANSKDAKDAIAKCGLVVIDTVGRMLDLMTAGIATDPKAVRRDGSLTIQGWGTLKTLFAGWMSQVRLRGIDVVMIAHEKEEREGESRYVRPDIQGGSYSEVMKFADMVGYLNVQNGNRVLDFSPSDARIGKNAAGMDPITIPPLTGDPTFFARVLADAKANIGRTSELSAKVAAEVGEWSKWVGTNPTLDEFNAALPNLGKLCPEAKTQAWGLCQGYAAGANWKYDKASKSFTA